MLASPWPGSYRHQHREGKAGLTRPAQTQSDYPAPGPTSSGINSIPLVVHVSTRHPDSNLKKEREREEH